MTKRYFIKEGFQNDFLEKTLIIAEAEDVIEKVELAGMVYVDKKDIENIEEYRIEEIDSNENAEVEDVKEYLFMTVEDFTADEKHLLNNEGYVYLDELEKYGDLNIDSLTDTEIEKLEKEAERELAQSVIEKMKKEGVTVNTLETYKAWGYYDGSNWKEITLEYFIDTEWTEITEELEGMTELDYQNYNTGHKKLYELEDGRKVLIDTSYYQGSLWGITFINTNVKTIKEAETWIGKENAKLSPYYQGE